MTMTHSATQERTCRRAPVDVAQGLQCEFLQHSPTAARLRCTPPVRSAPRSPEKDVMTTTTVRTPRAVLRCDGDVMDERFPVATRQPGERLRKEDTARVGIMRRITAARLNYCGLGAMREDVMLIVSELVTNAILHSGATEISLTVTLAGGVLGIKVCDGMKGSAQPKQANDNAESGRGLALVEGLVEENDGEWGVSDDGTEVWCRLPARGDHQ